MWTCSPCAGFARSHNWESSWIHASSAQVVQRTAKWGLCQWQTRLPKHLLYTMQNTLTISQKILKSILGETTSPSETITKKLSSPLRQPENREACCPIRRFPQPACSQEAEVQVWSQTQFSCPRQMHNWFLQILHYLTRVVNMHDFSASP